jgi:basic amino acid/polyamine antiporter, APA family
MSEGLEEGAPRPLLRRRDAVGIIVGIVIGAGIYKTPSMVAGVAGDAGWLVAAWIAGALISLIGALCYAELATTYPHAGGDYHFLTRAFGRPLSFLYAWARGTVINPGSMALLGFVFGDYLSNVLPLGAHGGATWAAIIIVVLTAMNIAGLRTSARTQNVLTILEVAGLVALAVAGFAASAPGATTPALFSSTPALGMFGLAMVFVLLTYGGWNEAAYISAELRGGRRAIVGALILSLLVIATVYVVVNLALVHGLGLKGLADSKTAGADAMAQSFGPFAAKLLGIFVAIAALTSINATMIVGARTNYAMGRDWPALRILGGWNAARGVPVAAYIVQATIALALVVFGAFQHDGFEAMVEFTAPVFWAFLFLVGISLFVLRARDGSAERPFRVPGFPLTPLVFCAVCAYLFYSSVTYAASRNAVHISLIVMAAGVVALVLTGTGSRGPVRTASPPALSNPND